MKSRTEKLIFWAPRILALFFMVFIALFSLDVFQSEEGLKNISIAFFAHNIPVFLLALVIIISWKIELVGAAFFVLAGIAYIFMVWGVARWQVIVSWIIAISGPAFLIGGLYFVSWRLKRQTKAGFNVKNISAQ